MCGWEEKVGEGGEEKREEKDSDHWEPLSRLLSSASEISLLLPLPLLLLPTGGERGEEAAGAGSGRHAGCLVTKMFQGEAGYHCLFPPFSHQNCPVQIVSTVTLLLRERREMREERGEVRQETGDGYIYEMRGETDTGDRH